MININLIAERRARKMREMTTLRFSTIGVLVVMVFAILLNIGKLLECQALRTEQKTAQKQLDELGAKRRELKKVTDEIEAKRPVVNLLEQVRVSEAAWMTILADTSKITPSDVMLSSFNTTPSPDGIMLHINGKAVDEGTVGNYMLAFRQQTRWAKTPTLGTVTAQDDALFGKRVSFDLTIPIKDLIGGEL